MAGAFQSQVCTFSPELPVALSLAWNDPTACQVG